MAPPKKRPEAKSEKPKGDRLARRGTEVAQPEDAKRNPATRVPGQDAFQNLPRRKAPDHLERNRAPEPPPEPPKQEKATQKTKSRPKRRVNPATRRRQRRLAVTIFGLFLIIAGLVFSFNVLFPIRGFTIQGETVYSEAEILQALQLAEGDNLLSFSLHEAEERLLLALPYLESAEVRRKLPETVVVRLTAATERYAFPYDEGWAVMSDSRRILRFDDATPEGVTAIYGLNGISAEVGKPLEEGPEENGFSGSYEAYLESTTPPPEETPPPIESMAAEPAESGVTTESAVLEDSAVIEAVVQESEIVSSEIISEEIVSSEIINSEISISETSSSEISSEQTSASEASTSEAAQQEPQDIDLVQLEEMLQLFSELGFSNITWVDISDPLNLRFRYEDRITVELGAYNHLQEKLEFVAALLLNSETGQITAGDRGVLDASSYPATTDRVWFTPE